MAISVSKMIDDVASTKYNKTNILLYFFIIIVLTAVIYLSDSLSFIPNYILAFTSLGYFVTTSNNEIHNKKSVFPSFSFEIIKQGFIFLSGNSLVISIFALPIIIIVALFTVIYDDATTPIFSSPTGFIDGLKASILGVLLIFVISIILTVILIYHYVIPLMIQYLISLKFEDFFNFKKAVAFRNNRKGLYKSYLCQFMLLFILYSFLTNILFRLITIFNPKHSYNSMFVLQIITIILMYNLIVITIPNLTGQLVHQTNNPENQA